MVVGDFSGPPLVLGDIYGARSFHYDKENGQLTAEYSSAVWGPGVNDSKHVHTRYTASGLGEEETLWWKEEWFTTCAGPGSCRVCGFYAYTNGRLEYGSPISSVYGVIRGWGTTEVGTRGFRCSKAEIVALYAPKGTFDPPSRWAKFVRWGQRNLWSYWWLGAFALIYQAVAIFLVVQDLPGFYALSFLLPLVFHGYCRTSAKYNGRKYRRELLLGPDIDFKLVREKYPNVEWYTDLDKMMSNYKLEIDSSTDKLLYGLLYGIN